MRGKGYFSEKRLCLASGGGFGHAAAPKPMNVSQLQRLDRWCGVPACFILTRLRRLLEKSSQKRSGSVGAPRNVTKVLFVKLTEQGSTVLAYPAIAAAIEIPALYSARSPRNVPLWAGLVCSPCINAFNYRQSPCRNNVCMQAISVEQVLTRVILALKEKGQGGEVRSRELQPMERLS